MIQMSLTAAGLAAVTNNSALTFTRFAAGSGVSNNETLAQACQDIPITRSQTYIAGQSYAVNGQQVTVDYNAVEITGMLSTAQAQEAYNWTELALMAREGAGEEFVFAYGSAVNNAYYIDPAEAVTYVIPFSVIFSDAPNVTVNTTASGVPWTSFLTHENTSVSDGAHGLRVSNGDLLVNGTALGLASLAEVDARTANVIGVNILVDALPANVMDYVGLTAYLRSERSCYKCQYSEVISAGDYVVLADGDWQRCGSDAEGALLVIDDEDEPDEGEITWSAAQAHFCGWVSMDTVESRLQALESSTSPYVKFKSADEREYNSEWVSRMTGAGTAASPYLIYTPYDFNAIRNNLNANYVLMNNLDFSEAIGIEVSLSGDGLVYGAVDAEAPLYNEGKGWEPFGRFYGVLDGNGKAVRGVVCQHDECEQIGIFREITGARISNLTVCDSVFISGRDDCRIGSIVGYASDMASYIDNCVSYATLYSSCAWGENWLGGIVGCVNSETEITNCANHGVIKALYHSNACIGGIAGPDKDWFFISGCRNTSDLEGKKVAGIGMYCKNIRNCYNSGTMTGSEDSYSLSTKTDGQIVNCCSLSGCAANVQGTALTAEQLKSAEAVELLNTGLQQPVFVTVEDGYPALDFEVINEKSLAPDLQVAVLDPSSQEVRPSGVTLGELMHRPGREDFRALKAEVAGKSSVSKVTLALPSADWDNGAQTVTAAGVSADSVLVLVPKSAEVFTYGLAISGQGSGEVTVSCASAPSGDISVDVLVIN